MMNGFVKLHRQIMDWEWYSDPNVKCVFIHLLLSAAHDSYKYRGITVDRGQLVFGYQAVADANGLTYSQVRTAIRKLKSTGEIEMESDNHVTILTVNNYEKYQNQRDRQMTDKNSKIAQTDDRQIADKNLDIIGSDGTSRSEARQTDDRQIADKSQTNRNIQECRRMYKKVEELYPARAREEKRDFDDVAFQVVSEFNRVCVDLPKVSKLTEIRKRLLFNDGVMDKPLSEYTTLFEKVHASDKLCGRGDLSWRADFDWIIKNNVKISEGTYDNVAVREKPPDKSRGGMYSAVGASFDLAAYERKDIFS